MRIKTLVAGYVFALALLLFGKQSVNPVALTGFSRVIDLSAPPSTPAAHRADRVAVVRNAAYEPVRRKNNERSEQSETRLVAPAAFSSSLWMADQIPAQRLVAPLVILDVRADAIDNPQFQLSVHDIAKWEREHGEIPQGSIVIAFTGWPRRPKSDQSSPHSENEFPSYSQEAAQFLIEGRNVRSLGIDTPDIDCKCKNATIRNYALARSVYSLENVVNLDQAPVEGAIVMVSPEKLGMRAVSPVRIMALAR